MGSRSRGFCQHPRAGRTFPCRETKSWQMPQCEQESFTISFALEDKANWSQPCWHSLSDTYASSELDPTEPDNCCLLGKSHLVAGFKAERERGIPRGIDQQDLPTDETGLRLKVGSCTQKTDKRGRKATCNWCILQLRLTMRAVAYETDRQETPARCVWRTHFSPAPGRPVFTAGIRSVSVSRTQR